MSEEGDEGPLVKGRGERSTRVGLMEGGGACEKPRLLCPHRSIFLTWSTGVVSMKPYVSPALHSHFNGGLDWVFVISARRDLGGFLVVVLC